MGDIGVIRVDQYQDIRQMYLVEGMSQRAIAKQLGISRNTVRRYCKGEHVPWERKPAVRQASVLTPDVMAVSYTHLDVYKRQVLVGGKELLMVYIKRFLPGVARKIVRKIKAT